MTGPVDSWTVHGLWPDNCDGTFEASCDSSRAYTGIPAALTAAGEDDTLTYMNKYWKDWEGDDESFWEHEWSKHGTCISTLDRECYSSYTAKEEMVDYFVTAVNLDKSRNTYKILAAAGITPSSSKTYTTTAVSAALAAAHGAPVTIKCDGANLNEVWYHYNVRGSVTTGEFVASAPDGVKGDCSGNIYYMPKSAGTPTTTTKTTTTAAATPTSTGVFSGKGYLTVTTSGTETGCLIGAGTWYVSGTCATITATASGSGFKLSSSKGPCAVGSTGAFVCSSSTTAQVFTASGGKLVGSGTNWYATSVPSGSTQLSVFTTSATGRTTVATIGWRSV